MSRCTVAELVYPSLLPWILAYDRASMFITAICPVPATSRPRIIPPLLREGVAAEIYRPPTGLGTSGIDCRGHGPQGGGREPSLDHTHERWAHPGQRVDRAGEGEHLVKHRVVRTVPLHREAFRAPLHVTGQGPEGEPVALQRGPSSSTA